MPGEGLEPSSPYGQRILSPQRIGTDPSRHQRVTASPKSGYGASYGGNPAERDPLALARALLAHAKTARNPRPLIEAADALLAEMDQGDSAPAAG